MHEEQQTTDQLESPSDLGEHFEGRILNKDGQSILVDSKYDVDLDLIIKQNSIDLINEEIIISSILSIYNGHDRTDNSPQLLTYRLFTLRNVHNLDEFNLTRLYLLKEYLNEGNNNESSNDNLVANSINDRLCDISGDELSTDEQNSLNKFWSEINLDLCDSDTRSDHMKPLLMCFICKLSFKNSNQLAKHADQTHNAQLNNAEKYLLLKPSSQSAILQLSSSDRPVLTFLANLSSELRMESSSPIQTNLQVATNNFLNSLLNDTQKDDLESQPKIADQKDEFEFSSFGDLNDLANLECIAKAAAAALHKTNLEIAAPNSPNSNLTQNTKTANNASSSVQMNCANNNNNFFANNQQTANLLNSLTGNSNNSTAVSNLVNLLPQLTVQQQQQLHLLATVNGSLLNSNTANLNSNSLTNSLQNCASSSSSQANSSNNNQSTQSTNNSSPSTSIAAGLGQHHMAMLHSRNSCKTLKCPKCNWHYKYQETLEIHMKEKHPETELNCVYCLANQAHPRLARGESYTCGYKPYRCEVCNYSTTTKGNLAIHMQSDKHINNVQELQSGNLPAEMLQSLVQQQQQLNSSQQLSNVSNTITTTTATTVTDQTQSTQTTTSSPSQITTTSNLLSPNNSTTTSLSNLNASLTNSSLVNSAVQSTNLNSNQSTLTNLAGQTPAITSSAISSSNNSSSSTNNQTLLQQQTNQQASANSTSSKAVWRCDVCKYDTNLARNLRIHMTSEKHTNNMLLLQQNVKQMQQLNTLQGANSNLDSSTTQAMLQQLNPNLLAALAAANSGTTSNQDLNSANLDQFADLTYNQALLLMSGATTSSQQLNSSSTNNQQQSNNSNAPKQLPNELLMLLPSDKQAIVDLEHPDPSLRMDYTDYDENHCRLFQCMVCLVFTCDSVEQLAAHLQIDRTKIREDEVLGALSGTFFCKLCPYKTSLKANFQLHCKTDKHLQRLQQVNHIKEGGQSNEWKLKYVNVSNPVQLRCNLCDYYTNSLHKLQLHVTNARHEASTRVFLHLKVGDQLLRANDNEIKQTVYCCEPCNLLHPTIFALLHHLNSARHVQSENFRQIKLQMEISQGKMTMKTLDEEIRELFTVKRDSEQDIENDNQTDLQSKSTSTPTQSTNTSSSKQLSQLLLCPLCQSQFTLRANLQQHIIDTHNVSKEGVERLMSIVDSVKENNVQNALANSPINKSTNQLSNQLNNSLNSNHSDHSLDYDDETNEYEPLKANNSERHLHKFRCTQCPLSFRTSDKLAIHSQYHKIRAASQCVLCGKTTRSIESMQKHMELCHKEMSEQELDTYRLSLINNPLLLSLKNGCQGVLDPATTELLKRESNRELVDSLNSKFEQNGSSTKVQEADSLDDELDEDDLQDINDSNNDSLMETDDNELNKEWSNKDLDNDEQQQLLNSINNSLTGSNEEYLNSQNVAEDSYNDPTRKYKCHRCRVAYTRQTYLSAHNKTLYHRKGEKLTYPMEKYLDPNRPFKCELCKESFTQKNILMTHYNSVSHLQRQNQAMKELNQSSTSLNESNDLANLDEQPFKCNVCKVSFNNSTQLDNHTQTVQHQSRISKLPQLAISGQIDLNKPLVERRNSNDKLILNDEQNNLNLINEQLQLLQQLTANQPQHNQLGNQQQQSNLNCQQCSMVFNNQDSLNQHQQICFLLSAVTNNNMSSNNNNNQINNQLNNQQTNNHQLNLIQQQQQLLQSSNSKFYNTPLCKSKPPVYKHLLETWGFEIVQQFNEHHQRRKNIQNETNGEMEIEQDNKNNELDEIKDENDEQKSNDNEMNENLDETNCDLNNDTNLITDNHTETTTGDNIDTTTDKIFDSTTEINNAKTDIDELTIKQDEVKDDSISKVTLKLILDQEQEEQEEKKENDPNTTNNPETAVVNKSKCETCLKEFSSIWVLKAHKEEVHKDVVKMQTVQDFAEIYRKEFERKNNIVVKSVVLESDPNNQLNTSSNNNLSRQQEPSPSAANLSTSTNNSTNDNLTVDQQQMSSDISSNDNKNENSSRSSSSRLDQTNELNNSTNSSSNVNTNSNNNPTNNNETNNLANSLLSGSNNPLLAGNPLLSQAVANMINQQQGQQNNGNSSVNDMANQMAQLQVNQLLVSLSLAGAMNNNSNNTNQTNAQQNPQQAAIMALLNQGLLPPQMLPILMANADPMMNLLAANPMLAAVAAAQQANPLANSANPLAGLLSGMTPDAMLGLGLPGINNNIPVNKSPNPIAQGLPNNILTGQTSSTTPVPSTNLLNNNQQSLQAQQAAQNAAAAAAAQSGKRARTRISDDQLKILRQYFDINNSPTEEALQEMAAKSQLPLKVIKHWFRNTLFKERQRNKDSPYNFNNPPSTYLNLEEYEKTGEAKVQLVGEDSKDETNNKEENSLSSAAITPVPSNSGKTTPALGQESLSISIKNEPNEVKSDSFNSSEDDEKITNVKQENTNQNSMNSNNQNSVVDNLVQAQQNAANNLQQFLAAMAAQSQQQLLQNQLNGLTGLNSFSNNDQLHNNNESMKSFGATNSPHSEDSMDSIATNDTSSQPNMQIYSGLQFANLPGMPPLSNSLQLALQNSQLNATSSTLGLLSGSNSATSTPSVTPNTSNSANNPGKRANRTRFTDYQIRVLQEFFETNAYPKDDDLDYLSKLLNLSPRVIVVWFQNARQKARKVYENQPPSLNDMTPGTPTMPPASTTPNANLTPCTTPNSATSSNSATPNPLGSQSMNNNNNNSNAQRFNYNCPKCNQSFQRYYEMIKHQKSSCFKDENPVTVNTKGLNKQSDNLNNSLSSNDFNAASSTSTNSHQQTAIQNGTFQCDKCTLSFNRIDLFQEHRTAHIMNQALFANLQQNSNGNGSNNSANGPFNMLNQFEAVVAAAQQAQQNQQSASPSLLMSKSPSTTPSLFGNNRDNQGGSNSPTPQQQQALLIQQQFLAQLQQANQLNKRKFSNDDDDDCDSQSGGDGSQCSGNGNSRSTARDKRLRTTILPEQLDFLYQKYNIESNPSRKMLESISEEVGLKKRVVQVWFQNARARSRKNQLKPHQQIINKRCPFCRALFKARSALESHLATRHADQYTKGEIDIDALPDSAESADEQSMQGLSSNALNSALGLANSLANLDNGDSSNGNPYNSIFGNNLLNASAGTDLSHLLQDSMGNCNNTEMANQLRQLISNIPNLGSLMNNMNNGNEAGNEDQDEEDEDQLTNTLNNTINNNNNESSASKKKKSDFALDLSKPLDLS